MNKLDEIDNNILNKINIIEEEEYYFYDDDDEKDSDTEDESHFGVNEKELEQMKKSMLEHPEYYSDELGERKIEDLTVDDFDFQGFLIPNIRLRQALLNLGFKIDKKTNRIYLKNDNPILDKVPRIYQDDGMGYGANNGNMTECHIDKNNGEVRFWF